MKKKIVSLCMVFALAASTLAACGNENKESTNPSESTVQQTEATQSTEVVEEIAYPEKLTIFSPQGTNAVKMGFIDNNETYWAKWLEETTGTKVEWTHAASDVIKEKFNLMIASGKYTDLIAHNWSGVEGGIDSFYEEGVILDLTELIPECMPNLNAYLEANPDVVKEMKNDAGQILAIPYIRDELTCSIYVGPLMRTDWISKLGMEVPSTPDELYEVFKAFKEKDPNGNGEADEIPLSGMLLQQKPYGIGNLAWAFDVHFAMYVEDGKVVWGPEQEKFVEALAYITKLYSEGLVDVDYLLNTRNTMDSKALADRVGMIFSYQATKYYNNKEFNNGTNRMQGIPYLSADGEKGMTFINDYTSRINSGVAVAVTSTCEDPKAALKWLDNLYSEEGLVVTNFGQEGVHYEIKDGKPFVDYRQMTTDEQTLTKANALAQDSTFPAIQKWDGVSSTYSVWGSEDIETWAASVDTSGILPKSVKLTVEESDAVGDLWTQLSAYADSIMNKIIIGEESIDNWPKYVEEFRGMGLDKIMAAYNAAYQRYLAR